jgi:hypothetical protein
MAAVYRVEFLCRELKGLLRMTERVAGVAMAVLGLTGLAWAATDAGPTLDTKKGKAEVRILWAGSSSLYFHNMPDVLGQRLMAMEKGPAIKTDLVGRSGTGVHVYLRPEFKAEYGLAAGQNVLDKIRQGKYDYVVLQVPAEFINGPEGEEHDKSLDVYCRAIREAGGEPVFYEMGWGTDEKADVGRQKIFDAAVRNKVALVAPCSSAWMRVRKERPDLELQNPPDKAHPGTLGLYLNMCCLYSTFTGKPPTGLPGEFKVWRRLTDEQKAEAKEKVAAAKFNKYESALPGWMKTNTVMAESAKLDADVAAYLQKTAWAAWQEYQARLKGKQAP